jgi:ubiquinol oxidase
MHLLTFLHIARPTAFERLLILLAQGIFYNCYFLLYLLSPRTAHRVTGYFEEEAIHSYNDYLLGVDNGTHENVLAPRIAIDYWKLAPDARLRDVIVAVRADEARHRDVNHHFADELA